MTTTVYDFYAAYAFYARYDSKALAPNKLYDETAYLNNNPTFKPLIKGHFQNPEIVIFNPVTEYILTSGREEILNNQ
jgi:hypothetical protein